MYFNIFTKYSIQQHRPSCHFTLIWKNVFSGWINLGKLRVPGVLQRFGISYFVVASTAMIFKASSSPRSLCSWTIEVLSPKIPVPKSGLAPLFRQLLLPSLTSIWNLKLNYNAMLLGNRKDKQGPKYVK